MSGLCPRPHVRALDKMAALLFSLSLTLCVGPSAPAQTPDASDSNNSSVGSLPAWTWVEKCHVQRGYRLTDFGTFGSLQTAADNQTVVSHPFTGKNRTGVSFLGTIKQDLWSGGALIAYAEGGTTHTLDHVIEDCLGTNGLAQHADVYLSHLYLLQNLADQHLQLALGRILLSDFFDNNRVANCEFVQFLSSSLVNNPTIPFPEAGMGAAARLAPVPWLYLQASAADAAAHATRSDFDTAFHSLSNIFGLFEFGLSPFSGEHTGTYRFLFWYDPASGEMRDNYGFAVSFDQPATDRLTLFFRYGLARAPVNALMDFVSVGAQLQKPLPGRDRDFLQAAIAWGNAVPRDETLVELGYSLHLTDNLALTPLVQIIADPARNPRGDTFVLAGLRAVYVF
jgi:carbohydrate-selective porin OprB